MRDGLPFVDPVLKEQVLALLDSVCLPPDAPWPFRENPEADAPAGLETACWGLVCLHLLRAHERLVAWGPRIVSAIDRSFNPTMGFYWQTDRSRRDAIGSWRLHNDWVCRATLEAAGLQSRPHPRGVAHVQLFPWTPHSDDELDDWLSRVCDSDPRTAVKEVFQYLRLYCDLMGVTRADQCDHHAHRVLAWLESQRDPVTGFVGMAPGVDLGWAMRNHRNMAFNLHWRLGVSEPQPQRLIDSTLACRRSDHLFHDGSMCANMDAVHLLAEYGLRTGHRRRESLDAIRACVRSIRDRLEVPAGGFRYTLDECPDLRTRGYGDARIVNGTAFVLYTIHYWRTLDTTAVNLG